MKKMKITLEVKMKMEKKIEMLEEVIKMEEQSEEMRKMKAADLLSSI